jgi:phosphatidate cytidylyltransferase
MKIRAASAILAVLLIAAIYYYFHVKGLMGICAFAALMALREYTRLVFSNPKAPPFLAFSFVVICSATYFGVAHGNESGFLALVFGAVVYLTLALTVVETKEDLPRVLQFQSMGLVGFLYCGLMPALATRLLRFDHGDILLFGLMMIVFSGDTMAYLVGMRFGKRRLLEAVSPKKSKEGAIGGLIGSGIAGLVLSQFVPGSSPWQLILVGMATGVFAQAGDLFESLLKRVADVKDSGRFMPGHGGLLDRLDGIYFGAPVYFILVRSLLF